VLEGFARAVWVVGVGMLRLAGISLLSIPAAFSTTELQGCSLGGRGVALNLRQALLKGYGRVTPDLDSQDYR